MPLESCSRLKRPVATVPTCRDGRWPAPPSGGARGGHRAPLRHPGDGVWGEIRFRANRHCFGAGADSFAHLGRVWATTRVAAKPRFGCGPGAARRYRVRYFLKSQPDVFCDSPRPPQWPGTCPPKGGGVDVSVPRPQTVSGCSLRRLGHRWLSVVRRTPFLRHNSPEVPPQPPPPPVRT